MYTLLFIGTGIRACDTKHTIEQANRDTVKAYFTKEAYKEVVAYTDTFLKATPNDPELWLYRGRALFHLGKENEALRMFNKAIEVDSTFYKAYEDRAILYNYIGISDTLQAFEDIDVAIKHFPNDLNLYKVKASLLYKTRRFEEAIEQYDKILAKNPNDYKVITYKARMHRELYENDRALEMCNTAIGIKPQDLFAYEERAFVYIAMEEYSKAIDDFNNVFRCLEENYDPKREAYTYDNRGFAYHKLGDDEMALEDINHSILLRPTNSYAYRSRALVYIHQGKTTQACTDLKEALRLGFTKKYGEEVEQLVAQHCQ
ncbi:MAG: tetratricopeptide repeat protein [Thermonemataceae bacterium]